MRHLILSVMALLLVLLTGCANRHKMPNLENLCLRQLSQAQNLFRQPAKDRDNRITDLANNLIIGAKMAREQHEYSQCIDKSSRATKLLNPDAKLAVQVEN